MKALHYSLAHLTCFAGALIAPLSFSSLQAVAESETLEEPVKCTKEELINFFPQQIVEHVLIKAKIPADKAKKIAVELSQKNMELTKIVEEKSLNIEKNPLNGSSLHDATIKIYGETLHNMFSKVLKSYGITDEGQMQSLLEQIRVERSKHFIECIRLQQSIPSSED